MDKVIEKRLENPILTITRDVKKDIFLGNYTYDPVEKKWYQFEIMSSQIKIYHVDEVSIRYIILSSLAKHKMSIDDECRREQKVRVILDMISRNVQYQIPYWVFIHTMATTNGATIELSEIIDRFYEDNGPYISSFGRPNIITKYIRDFLFIMGYYVIRIASKGHKEVNSTKARWNIMLIDNGLKEET